MRIRAKIGSALAALSLTMGMVGLIASPAQASASGCANGSAYGSSFSTCFDAKGSGTYLYYVRITAETQVSG
jgi:hypothetical protein